MYTTVLPGALHVFFLKYEFERVFIVIKKSYLSFLGSILWN